MSLDIVITGIGTVSPFGVGKASWKEALMSSGSDAAFRVESEVLETEHPGRTAEVWGWAPKEHLGPKGHRSYDRLTKFLIAAAKHALRDAGVKNEEGFVEPFHGEKVGLCSATAYGSLDAITELNRVAELEDPRYINPTRFPNTVINAAAGYVSIWEELKAPNTTIVAGNCGAIDAVLTAATHLRNGRAHAMLVGGGEVVSEPLHRALDRLGVLRGGSGLGQEGQGVEMGEGACYLVVERRERAIDRKATVLAEILGYGTAFEPPTSEALLVHASAEAVERAARSALKDANVDPADISAVLTAKGGIDAIDRAEEEGIARVVAAPRRALKELHGETFGAAGAFALASAAMELQEDRGPILISTVGFYGNASAVVVGASKG